MLTIIGGHLSIMHSGSTNLSGLDNLTHIGGYLSISGGYGNLTSLEGLNNLSYIGGYLRIQGQDLISLSGLESLTSIQEDMIIKGNDALLSFDGLDNLTSIGGNLKIGDPGICGDNPLLSDISALSALDHIGGNLSLSDNYALTDLNGLEGLTTIPGELFISGNASLSSLSGLENVTSIGERLHFCFNNIITDFSGLDNLISIGGSLSIKSNASMISLSGLNNLTAVGKSLSIGGYNGSESQLLSLSALSNLASINGSLSIEYNHDLTSLTGLDNIDPGSITSLSITNNPALTTCEIFSVCDYLISINPDIEINNNATGCNDADEVMEVCEYSSVSEGLVKPVISIYPNPSKEKLFFGNRLEGKIKKLIMYNQLGQILMQQSNVSQKLDISHFCPGLYIIEMHSNSQVFREKLIIKE